MSGDDGDDGKNDDDIPMDFAQAQSIWIKRKNEGTQRRANYLFRALAAGSQVRFFRHSLHPQF